MPEQTATGIIGEEASVTSQGEEPLWDGTSWAGTGAGDAGFGEGRILFPHQCKQVLGAAGF